MEANSLCLLCTESLYKICSNSTARSSLYQHVNVCYGLSGSYKIVSLNILLIIIQSLFDLAIFQLLIILIVLLLLERCHKCVDCSKHSVSFHLQFDFEANLQNT